MTVVEMEQIRKLIQLATSHAAEALGLLLAQEVQVRGMQVSQLQRGDAKTIVLSGNTGPVGVFFEVKGGIGGMIGFFVSEPVRDHLVRRLLGRDRKTGEDPDGDSALCEVGNILISKMVSAISDELGEPIIPSIPDLEAGSAKEVFLGRVSSKMSREENYWLETDLLDSAGTVLGHFVTVPEGVAQTS